MFSSKNRDDKQKKMSSHYTRCNRVYNKYLVLVYHSQFTSVFSDFEKSAVHTSSIKFLHTRGSEVYSKSVFCYQTMRRENLTVFNC